MNISPKSNNEFCYLFMSLVEKIRGGFYQVVTFPMKVVKYSYAGFVYVVNYAQSFIHHFKILREANISLGKYHLQNGNFRDASLRFWLINRFISKDDLEAKYWNGWTKILRKNYKEAIDLLQNNSFDKIGLASYIINISSVNEIPESIEKEYRSFSTEFSIDRYFNDKENVFELFQNDIIPFIPTDTWNIKKGTYNVLEIGTYPFFMEELSEFLPENYAIDGINFIEEETSIAKEYNEKEEVYRNLATISRPGLNSLTSKYDLINFIDTLSFTINLANYFKELKKLLATSGIMTFVLRKGNLTKLDPSSNSFMYNQEYIQDQLKLAEFELLSITSIKIDNNFEYFMVIAK